MSRVPKRCSAELSFGLSRKHWTMLEKLARSKRSSLLRKFVNQGRKKFYNIGPCRLFVLGKHYHNGQGQQPRLGQTTNTHRLELEIIFSGTSMLTLILQKNKLECLSLASIIITGKASSQDQVKLQTHIDQNQKEYFLGHQS